MNHLDVNRALWNARVPFHVQSEFYDLQGFLAGASTLTEIELPLLGNISGKHVLHLQCHFGLDTLSLARLGARVTGLDFSETALSEARRIATHAGLDARFVLADVYDAAASIPEPADCVFTSYGVLGWLPDLTRWAREVAHCLHPGGELVLAEFHPVIWMYDDQFSKLSYSYFKKEPIIEQSVGTYADTTADLSLPSMDWNFSLGELLTALLEAGFRITHFQEYDFSPFPCFPGSVVAGQHRWQISGKEALLPMCFSLKAQKE
ncbi:MAG: class I SAM-dependent methyltransferase [Bacteroidetes bacterium]|nr:class I SAM-dependent methyltransferase [Bacteroidota bacterium]MBS1628844.1 class I SAM-dependent methyltransferase [Bacteroidota bacterium]